MNKIVKGLGIGVLVIGIGILGLAIWQKDNVISLVDMVKYSEAELATSIEQNKKQMEQVLESYNVAIVRDFTLEEEEEIRRGNLTPEEAVTRIYKEQGKPTEAETTLETTTQSTTEPSTPSTSDQVAQTITEYTAKMYVIKAKYIGLLGDIENRALGAYRALPEDQRKLKDLQSLAMGYVSEAMTLEATCDAEVAGVLEALEGELVELGEETTIITQMREAYHKEKSLKKSYYISLVSNR